MKNLDPRLVREFLNEISRQCKFATISYDQIVNQSADMNHFWSSAQSFLVSTANISKIFWPPSPIPRDPVVQKEYQDRASFLKNLLSISDASPLNNRDVRNDFEHFDARLHTWLKETAGKTIIDSNIMQKGALEIGPVSKFGYLRNYDPTDFTLTFWDHEYNLKNIRDSIVALLVKVTNLLQTTYSIVT